MAEIFVPDKERLNLLGCFLEKIISKNCEKYSGKHRFKQLKLLIVGSEMAVNLEFHENNISVYPSNHDLKPDLVIKARLKTFLDITLGANPVGMFLKRKISLKGNPLKL
ncbi:MAG: SCP2 sterol-binding domain-containing protein, partial [Spirochaetota bacterium]|nr:SCP2 sterol-binding domain-containing protein [Spirochaetota bacterium]